MDKHEKALFCQKPSFGKNISLLYRLIAEKKNQAVYPTFATLKELCLPSKFHFKQFWLDGAYG